MSEHDWQVTGTMAKAERDEIERALLMCEGEIKAAARRLRIGRSTLYRLIKLYEIDITSQSRSECSQESSPDATSRIVIRDGSYFIESIDVS